MVRTEGLLTAKVEREIVILNLASNNYIGLDEIGRRLWDLLVERRRVDDLCRQMGDEFDGAPEQIRADVLSFLNGLACEGLLRVVDGQPS